MVSVYVSYAWMEEEQNGLVDKPGEGCKARRMEFVRVTTHVGYGDSIRAFMDEIAKAQHIVLVLSDTYFRSDYRMYELCGVYAHSGFREFRKRVHPIVLRGTALFDRISPPGDDFKTKVVAEIGVILARHPALRTVLENALAASGKAPPAKVTEALCVMAPDEAIGSLLFPATPSCPTGLLGRPAEVVDTWNGAESVLARLTLSPSTSGRPASQAVGCRARTSRNSTGSSLRRSASRSSARSSGECNRSCA